MKILTGIGASSGVVMGNLFVLENTAQSIEPVVVSNGVMEYRRFKHTRSLAIMHLNILQEKARGQVGSDNAQIFEMQKLFLEDPQYDEFIKEQILGKRHLAEYAVQQAEEYFCRFFSRLDSDYMRARAADVEDASRRLIHLLTGDARREPDRFMHDSSVLATDDILPSDTINLDDRVQGVVTSGGSACSHAAILARDKQIPAVMGIGEQFTDLRKGEMVLVDGENGVVFISPTEEILHRYRRYII